MNDLVYSLNGGLVTDQNKISTISKVRYKFHTKTYKKLQARFRMFWGTRL